MHRRRLGHRRHDVDPRARGAGALFRAPAPQRWPALAFARGLVHEVAAKAMAGRYENVRAYVAGPPPAVDAALRMLLLEAKLTSDNIRYDKYT